MTVKLKLTLNAKKNLSHQEKQEESINPYLTKITPLKPKKSKAISKIIIFKIKVINPLV